MLRTGFIRRAACFRPLKASVPSYRPLSFTAFRLNKNQEITKSAAQELASAKEASDLIGPGGREGEVPTDIEQATGLERLELLAELSGQDAFDMKPLDASRKGTLNDPIIVTSLDPYRHIGCSGSPSGSHDLIWMTVNEHKPRRCPECGSVYKLKYNGDPHASHH
ncbi:cytochrome c oxidase subunit IV [Schizosaccharomyces octosporus yFS286]|uniref:Cytochrome c oxidase subunit 4, mitochondrial n=1 Tax=Schizosaccharomyces octosporus (strain yFS286) TaxID=483514 RepID=S9RKP8_SCHOY|nr:cytochrome c oxidase subunit IV [Schizosaccharomyces octosporus yFS286]EPX74534.1 cytochrome c oxidase subunit IV [Schizosaccharomyces octosporus yFS286]